MQPILFSHNEAARLLGICRKTLLRAAYDGEVKGVIIGRQRKYMQADLDAYRCRNEPKPASPPPPPWCPPEMELRAFFSRIRSGAKLRGLPFEMTITDVAAILRRSGGRCELSGIAFSREVVSGRRPWDYSIDRIDSSRREYTPDNCRVVCYAVNVALNAWGDDVLLRIAENIMRRRNG